MRPMFASHGKAAGSACYAFVSQASLDTGAIASYGLTKLPAAVRNCRQLGKRDMKLNDATPHITVDSETYHVTADGEALVCTPAESLPLAQRYCLF